MIHGIMRFRANVTLTFDAPSLNEAGVRLRELAAAAHAEGFDLERGQVEEIPAEAQEQRGWAGYGPLADE